MSLDITNEIKKCKDLLTKGNIILYPTDTVWGIGCDATNFEAVEKIYQLKQRADSKTMICLVNSIQMLNQYIEEVPSGLYFVLNSALDYEAH